MDNSNKKTSEPSRFQWKVNHYIGLALIFLIFFAVNYISGKRFFRENISSSTYTQITDLSKNILQNIKEPVELINYVSAQDDPMSGLILDDVNQLLKEYDYYGGDQVKIRQIDPYLHYDLAREIADEFKVALQESVLIVKVGEQNAILNYRDLADIAGQELYSQTPPQVTAFKAEQQITAAIQSLINPEQSVMYFITGHGEYDIEAPATDKLGLSKLATYIERQNIQVKSVNLIEAGGIPDDADLIVIAGPQAPYLDQEIEMIRAYIRREDDLAGRLLLFLDPQTETGLENLLSDYGVSYRNDLALTHVMILGQVRTMEDAIITRVADHPTTKWMQGRQLNMGIGKSRTLQIAPTGNAKTAFAAISLLMTPESYWGETEPGLESVQPTEGVDARGPLTVAVLIDEGSLSGGQVNLKADRIVAVGGAEFLTNQSLQGNQLDLFLNLSNWMLDKESSLGISPKVPEEFNLTLDDRQKQILSGTMVLLVPLLGLLMGFLVWLRRKK